MKYKYTIETEHEIEIELPYYFKIENSNIQDSYFAIISENVGISNWRLNDISSITCPQILTRWIKGSKQITAEEFKTALTQSCNHLINLA
jgi:hypothetical protein